MRIVLLGKSGLLGSYFLKYLAGKDDFEMFAFSSKELDLLDSKKVYETFKRLSPDIIINCAAYTDVEKAQENHELSDKLNAEVPKILADSAKKENSILIHFSSDYVFDGTKKDGYDENDPTNPVNYYGKSKLLGENFIKDFTDKYYIARTQWLYGANGNNFVDTMLKLSKDRDSLKVINDQFGAPTYTHDLVEAVVNNFIYPTLSFIEKQHEYNFNPVNYDDLSKLDFGIYHLVNDGNTNWFDFAKKIFELKNINIDLSAISTEEYNFKAPRPSFSILKNNKVKKLRSCEDAIISYLKLYS